MSKVITIAVDAMGGENSPKKIILIRENGSKVSLKPVTGFNHFK